MKPTEVRIRICLGVSTHTEYRENTGNTIENQTGGENAETRSEQQLYGYVHLYIYDFIKSHRTPPLLQLEVFELVS